MQGNLPYGGSPGRNGRIRQIRPILRRPISVLSPMGGTTGILGRGVYTAGALLLVVLVGLLAAPWLVDVNRYRGTLESRLQDRLGRKVSLGRMTLSLLPPGLTVRDVVI